MTPNMQNVILISLKWFYLSSVFTIEPTQNDTPPSDKRNYESVLNYIDITEE